MRQLTTGLAALLLALVPPSAATATDRPLETIESLSMLAVEGDAYINADGTLGDYRIDTPAPGDTAAKVVNVARGWHFEPPIVDGKPQAVVARMRVSLAATQVGQGYQVRVDSVSFPELSQQRREYFEAAGTYVHVAKNATRPIYPHGLAKSDVAGRVLIALRYDDSGKVTEVAAVQSMLYDRHESEKVASRAIELFEGAALEAARQWRIQNATAAPFRVVFTNVEFVMDRSDRRGSDGATAEPGKWRLISRTPRRHVEWLDGKREAVPAVSDVVGGELVPVAESRLKLRDPVVGTLL
jgi:hypothetical protein